MSPSAFSRLTQPIGNLLDQSASNPESAGFVINDFDSNVFVCPEVGCVDEAHGCHNQSETILIGFARGSCVLTNDQEFLAFVLKLISALHVSSLSTCPSVIPILLV
jgi:hypothetical protein